MDWLNDNAWAAWLALAAGLGVAELIGFDLILVMLAVGALAGLVTAVVLPAAIALQVLAAVGASLAMLALVRPNLIKRLDRGPDLQLGHGKLVGRHAIVTAEISEHQVGRVRVAGEIWSAQAYDETITIRPGETVEVFEIRGATVYVHPVPSLESD